MVGAKGIEPPCIAAPDPKSGASTNFATRPFQNIQLSNLYFGRNWSTISYASRSAQLGHAPISKYSVVKSLLRAKLVYHIVCVALCATRPRAHFKIFSCQSVSRRNWNRTFVVFVMLIQGSRRPYLLLIVNRKTIR